MQRYILKRIAQAIFTVLAITALVFFLMRLSGDPVATMAPPDADPELVEMLTSQFGLDKPVIVQFWLFLKQAVQGDFGESFRWQQPALSLVWNRFPATMELALVAAFLAWGIGIPIGIISAVRRDTWPDRFVKAFALFGQATPMFWLGVMLMLLVGVKWDLLPISGREGWTSVILPASSISFMMLASVTRLSRSTMIEALNSEYVTMARLKGVPSHSVILIHAFKNACIPILTLMALQITRLFMGAVVAETIFSWPGLGKLALEAVFSRDFPVVQVVVLFSSALFCTVNILVDILYAYVDPRIRYQ
jgi:peptide/nickel transport system permease protein